MRIAFLSMYTGLVARGVETYVASLGQRLAKTHEVTVFQGGAAQGQENYKIELFSVSLNWDKRVNPALKRLYLDYWSLKIFWFSLRIFLRIWRGNFDVVIPTNGGWQVVLTRLAAWLGGSKLIISGQAGVGFDEVFNLWSFPDAFVALSAHAEKWARRINPFLHVEKIPNGVDLQKFKPEGQRLPVDLSSPIVLFVGALEEGKRPLRVIEAVANLRTASLIVVGDGSMKEEVERFGKELLPGRFVRIALPHDQMPKAYRTANVFTVPSRSHYSFEIVLVEAMATNLPVVANNDSVRQEIVGDAGILINPENISEYTLALREALTRSWKDIPQQQARKFSWDKIAEEYNRLFKKLVVSGVEP